MRLSSRLFSGVARAAVPAIFKHSKLNSTLTLPYVEGQLPHSILLAHYTAGMDVEYMHSDQLDGIQYSVMLTKLPQNMLMLANRGVFADPGTLIYRFELPFHTEAHIAGISTHYKQALVSLRPFINVQKMEKIELEGDFSRHFSLYAAHGQQVQVRYVFDPKAMQHTIDYCNSYLWEILADELYLVVLPGSAPTSGNILDHTVRFIHEIQPALINQLPGHDLPHRTPYGKNRGEPMKCPVCQSVLSEQSHWYECPAQHGRLISGREIIAVKKGEINVTGLDEKSAASHKELTCPHCQANMEMVDYQSTGIIIDSCSKCHYRWVDAGELRRIAV